EPRQVRACIFRAAVPDRHAAYASDQRPYSSSFQSNEACGRALDYLRLCETRSPRRHSHWSPPSGRPRQGSGRSVLAEPHDELALVHSITSSARASSVGGTARPSACAVLRLMTSSNLVGCTTGRSAGLVPLRILST